MRSQQTLIYSVSNDEVMTHEVDIQLKTVRLIVLVFLSESHHLLKAAHRVAVAQSSQSWHMFFVIFVALNIISHSFQTLTVKYSQNELLNNNAAFHQLPADFTIPAEITRSPSSTPEAEKRRRRRCERLQKRGKRGGTWARLKANPFKPPLPTIFLSNARSARNKMDEIRGTSWN